MSFLTYLFSSMNRYFSRVFMFWIVTCSCIVLSVISLFEATEQARRAMSSANVGFNHILEIILLKIPNHLQLLLPFIVLTASLVAFSRLNNSNEITMAKSSGISVWQLIGGLSFVSFFVAMVQLMVINPLGATLNARLENLEQSIYSSASSSFSLSETGLWIKEIIDDRESIIHIQHISLPDNEMRNVTFHYFSLDGAYKGRIDAEKATLDLNTWHLYKATRWTSRDVGTYYENMTMPSILSLKKILNTNTSPESLSFWQLPRYIRILEKSGLSSLPFRLYWHELIAKIGMMVTMILLAASFSLRPIRQGYTTTLIALGVGSGFFLHFMNDIVYALGMAGRIPPILAAWAPSLIMAGLSAALLMYTEESG